MEGVSATGNLAVKRLSFACENKSWCQLVSDFSFLMYFHPSRVSGGDRCFNKKSLTIFLILPNPPKVSSPVERKREKERGREGGKKKPSVQGVRLCVCACFEDEENFE